MFSPHGIKAPAAPCGIRLYAVAVVCHGRRFMLLIFYQPLSPVSVIRLKWAITPPKGGYLKITLLANLEEAYMPTLNWSRMVALFLCVLFARNVSFAQDDQWETVVVYMVDPVEESLAREVEDYIDKWK